jgi:hypothetical protein
MMMLTRSINISRKRQNEFRRGQNTYRECRGGGGGTKLRHPGNAGNAASAFMPTCFIAETTKWISIKLISVCIGPNIIPTLLEIQIELMELCRISQKQHIAQKVVHAVEHRSH